MIKRIVCLQICAILLLFLTGCYTDWMPQKGDWFCEELQIQMDQVANQTERAAIAMYAMQHGGQAGFAYNETTHVVTVDKSKAEADLKNIQESEACAI